MQERFGIAAFRSRQQALKLEAALKREGLPVRMISTPREVARAAAFPCALRGRTLRACSRRWSACARRT